MAQKNHGFTILELAVVSAIIALLVGGIFMGHTLMKSSQLQSITSDVDGYIKAVQAFRDKYKELPGDMPNAESFWGSEAACPNTVYTAASHTITCNGNGNTHIGDLYTDAGATNYEWYRAWQHLANALLLRHSFNGIAGSGSSSHSLPGINVPPSKYEIGGFTMYYIHVSNFAADANNFAAEYGHVINFGAPVANSYTNGPLLTPDDALLLDQKMDDALPAFGKVLTSKSPVAPNCTTSDTASSSRYNTGYTARACNLVFITGF
jgi:prepilin-type N-terminal cleavage/methylation domain-containing protein